MMMSPWSGCILASFSDSCNFSSHMSGLDVTSSTSCKEEQGLMVAQKRRMKGEGRLMATLR